MKKHLFVTGPIQSGKSTLLKDSLLPYEEHIGGFVSQKLIDEAGNTKGFRLADIKEKPDLTAPFDNSLNDIFILFDNGKHIDLSVFEEKGTAILEKTFKEKKILLLDETGGIELKTKYFKEMLLSSFEKTTCIGVLKAPLSAKNMQTSSEKDNAFFLDFITKNDTIILEYKRKEYEQMKNFIRKFTEGSIYK